MEQHFTCVELLWNYSRITAVWFHFSGKGALLSELCCEKYTEPKYPRLICCFDYFSLSPLWMWKINRTNELFDNPLITFPQCWNTEGEWGAHLDNGNNTRLFAVTVIEEGLLPKFHGSQEIPCLSDLNQICWVICLKPSGFHYKQRETRPNTRTEVCAPVLLG